MTPLWADTLIELVKNEVGLVITGHFCVDKMQRADAGQPVLDEATDESLLRRACDGVHRYGGKLFFQLSHSGIKGVESVNGAPPKHPEDFTREELDRLVEQFAFAAWTERRSAASTSTAARGRRRRSIWTRSSASRTLPKSGAQDGSKCLACNGCYTIYRKRFVRCVQHQDEIEQFKTIPW